MFSLRTSQFIDKRLGEHTKGLSQDEKYSQRLRMVRKRQNKRASKFSLENETELTHFGKRLNDMSKTELRTAYIGSGDEESEEPFSYEGLIAKSKEERAAARRQKMEAEAELEELDDAFKTVFNRLERRDIEADKVLNSKVDVDDDLTALARSFQMDNIKKAMAGDRSLTNEEKQEQIRSLVVKSMDAKKLAASARDEGDDGEFAEDEDVVVESDSDSATGVATFSPDKSSSSSDGLFGLVNDLLRNPSLLRTSTGKLVEAARLTEASDIDAFFKTNLFDQLSLQSEPTAAHIILMKIVSVLFPLDHMRHSIVNPTIKLLESVCFSDHGNMCHLRLLCDFLVAGQKYSPAFLDLAGRLSRKNPERHDELLQIVSEFCACFTMEALYGPISHFFPELMEKMNLSTEKFIPLKLHHFKPVEVLGLDPAFHEDGSEWNGQHKEIKESKRMAREFKKEKKLTVKEMRREAAATETFHAIQRNKEREKTNMARKRFESQMQQAEQNWRLTKTDQGKQDNRKMKSNKKRRRQ